MKNVLILVCLILIIFVTNIDAMANGDHPFSDHVSKLWFEGKKAEVLDIANKLLQDNPNDIVGLILKMGYELEFLMFGEINVTISKVLEVSENIKTAHFTEKYSLLKADLTRLRDFLIPNYPPEELEKDMEKVNRPYKQINFLYAIIAAEEDGLVSMDTIIP